MTNLERIQNMNAEEMAEEIFNRLFGQTVRILKKVGNNLSVSVGQGIYDLKEQFVEWLESEVEE